MQLTGRKARLEAERDRAAAIRFPADFLSMSEEAAGIAQGEKRLFDARRTAMKGQVAQLRERIGQFRQEIKGLTAQRDAKDQEVELMTEEFERLEGMRKKELMPVTRTLAAQRDLTKLKGEWGSLVAQIARAHGQISETELQIINVEQTFLTDASKELREIEARIGELLERRIAAEDLLKRIHLRAPQSGVVHDLSVHTVGGVIGPGETVMSIVPSQDVLSVEARIATSDIDQVHRGPGGDAALPGLQSAHDAGDQRHGDAGRRRPHARRRRPTRCSSRPASASTIWTASTLQAGAGHAGRGVHRHRRAHGALLPRQARHRPVRARLSRAVDGALLRCGRSCNSAPVRAKPCRQSKPVLSSAIGLCNPASAIGAATFVRVANSVRRITGGKRGVGSGSCWESAKRG